MPRSYCTFPNCNEPHFARSLCSRHYAQWQRGKTMPINVRGPHNRTPEERFWEKVDKNGPLWEGTPCWVWTASTTHGYGQFKTKDRRSMHLTHRWAYQTLVGPIPPKTELDHLCRNRLCLNPAHLEPVTHLENIRRGHGHGSETHCPQGHPYIPSNMYISSGRRRCRTCVNKRNTSYRLQRSP
jgi:hypothetical protein